MSEQLTIGFIGNPNCGKTTLFNAYTGANLKVANWPGVTVERMEGAINEHGHTIRLVDLPGTYSLNSFTMEEQVTRQFLESDQVSVIIDVADASSLERSLYLTLQLIEMNKPMVLALNMMDIVEKRGIDLDIHRLSEILGVPVIPVTARKKRGLKTLLHAALHQYEDSNAINHQPMDLHSETIKERVLTYSPDIERQIAQIEEKLTSVSDNPRLSAIEWLLKDEETTGRYKDYDLPIQSEEQMNQIINQKYDFIQAILNEVLLGREKSDELSEKIDAVALKPFWGIVLFLLIMAGVFELTFSIGDWISGYVEILIGWFTEGVGSVLVSLHTADWLINLICDGIISGVGGILTFLPNITILFIALAFLEDSGYMARVAYIMNDIMEKLGLSGRAFIPMVLGFGCTVPAIMASRALESKKDRRRVMLITPFMSCSAKLPVYILFAGMFFPKQPMWAAYSLYVIGIGMALLLAWILKHFEKEAEDFPLLIELPAYKAPSAHTVLVYVWDKVKSFLMKAGTIIFAASIVLWLFTHFSISGYTEDISVSFAAQFGKAFSWVLVPCGLGFWQIVVALIAGVSAKEVVVSSMAVLFQVANANSFEGMQAMHLQLEAIGFGALNAYCMMLFCLLYVPCLASLATIKKESGSSSFMWKSIAFQLFVSWTLTTIVYQVGSLFV